MKSKEPVEYIGKPLWDVLEVIRSGRFGHDHHGLLDTMTFRNDFYLIAHDFYSYAKT